MIRAGHLTPGHGRALLAVKPPKRQLDLAARTVADALSVRQLEHLVYRAPTKRESASQTVALKAPHIRQIEDALSERFGTKVTVHAEKKRRRGRIIIEFYTNDDFERILQTVGLGPGGD